MADSVSQATPLDIFNSAFDRAKKQFEALKVDDFFGHKLIACRADLQIAFQQIQFIHPSDKVAIHNKIADAQLIAMKIG